MKLIASMIVKDEADRYLRPCIDHLLEFCDEIRILDDGSTDAFADLGWVPKRGVQVLRKPTSEFYDNEGARRHQLLTWTMEGNPTHILAIDADEFVVDGPLLRQTMAQPVYDIWKLTMREVWAASDGGLEIRQDNHWRGVGVPIAYRVPGDWWTNRQIRRHWKIPDRKLASGRLPVHIVTTANRTTTHAVVTDILHFGWACKADRAERYERYVVHDGGRFHDRRHLDSIMWTDRQVRTVWLQWPEGIQAYKTPILERASRT